MLICKQCEAGCCRKFSAPVTGFDILRIWRTLEIDPFAFCEIEERTKEQLEKEIEKEPLFIFTDSGTLKYYQIYLKRTFSSKYFPNNRKCIFLQEWDMDELNSEELKGIVGRCGIYDCRPLKCRIYPAKFADDGKMYMYDPYYASIHPSEVNVWKNLPYSSCPRPKEREDYEKFVDQFIRDIAHEKYEMEFFLDLSKKWNENPDISDKFIEFLEREYRDRLPLKT